MDRNQVTGLLLIFLMLMLYYTFFTVEPPPAKEKKEEKAQKIQTEDSNQPLTLKNREAEELADSSKVKSKFGAFAALMYGASELSTLENENLAIKLNSKGGVIQEVRLKKFVTYDKKPLLLLDEKNSYFSLKVTGKDGKIIDLYRLNYKAEKISVNLKNGNGEKLVFSAELGGGEKIEHIYTLAAQSHMVEYNIRLTGFDKTLAEDKKARFFWLDKLKRQEFDLEQERYYSTINYYDAGRNFNYLSWPSPEKQEKSFDQKVHWFAFKQKFFTSAFISNQQNLENVFLQKTTDVTDNQIVKTVKAYYNVTISDLSQNKGNFSYYFGPNRYQILNAIPVEGFYQNMYLGWPIVNIFSRYLVIPIFSFLEKFISNYGIIIILLVIIIKLILLPLTYRSYISMAKMKVLKPEMDEIKERVGGDQQKMQMEQMELYRKMGVNPLSGCIPLLLQMPVILAMFTFFPNSIELRQEAFLWAKDLSVYDSILQLPFTIPFYGSHVSLFTILMTASTIWLTHINNQSTVNMDPTMKTMGYIMPVVFMFILNTFPAGLSFYYLVQNVVSVGQQALIRRFVDDSKIREILEQNKLKNKDKKKSKWRQRLEEAYQKAQEQSDQKNKEKQKKVQQTGKKNTLKNK